MTGRQTRSSGPTYFPAGVQREPFRVSGAYQDAIMGPNGRFPMNRRRLLKQMAVPLAAPIAEVISRPSLAARDVGPATERTPALTEYQKLRCIIPLQHSLQ